MQDVLFKFNAQHVCLHAGCEASGKKPQVQERLETLIVDSYIQHRHHQLTNRFIINTHAFHNAHLLRTFLPRSVIAPLPLYSDRISKHKEFAQGLRSTQVAKRDEQRKKRASKKAATAAAKVGTVQSRTIVGEDIDQELETDPSGSGGKRKRGTENE